MPRIDNQKVVTAYLPLELYDRLEDFKNSEGLKSDSKAIVTMLERWFFEPAYSPVVENPLESRLKDLEDKYLFLSQCIEALKNTADNTVESTVNSTVNSTVEDTVEDTVNGTVKGTVDNTVKSTVEDAVESTVNSTVDSTVEDTVEGTVNGTVEDTVECTVECTVEGTVDDTLKSFSKGLSQRALSKRLGCTWADITNMNILGHLTKWSQREDPQGLAWELRDKRYYPLVNSGIIAT